MRPKASYGALLASNNNEDGLNNDAAAFSNIPTDQVEHYADSNTSTEQQTLVSIMDRLQNSETSIITDRKRNYPLIVLILAVSSGFIYFMCSQVLDLHLPSSQKRDENDDDARGLSLSAYQKLHEIGLDAYLGRHTAESSEDAENGWTKHTFDNQSTRKLRDGRRMDGPSCISGDSYSVFSRKGSDSSSLLIFLQGGGACWSDFYQCSVNTDGQEPPFTFSEWGGGGGKRKNGVWDDDNPSNPFRDYNIVYMPYCDGSAWVGDNDVKDPSFPDGDGSGWRYHRGLQNQSAGLDVAKSIFPNVDRITLAGSSAGGIGVSTFTPFLVRFLFGNGVDLSVFNDAGPVMYNPSQEDIHELTESEWGYQKYFLPSCKGSSFFDRFFDWIGFHYYMKHKCHTTDFIRWRLDNDLTVRDAFYETDGDMANRYFLGLLTRAPNDGATFRRLVVDELGSVAHAHADRYRRFIVSGDQTHTILQSDHFYDQTANGVLLTEWTEHFLMFSPQWKDIVEENDLHI
uniref:Pectin acetylesterase n=1 Tax=Helicotheca tamesis TaxID=374047 RepID=A0A7S2IG06_9STRA|mmetsp:Transcript_9089/g.12603  ORF Transcript_9089/g.12603 Transcript_9089/m.12603 type:complete len:513 (+) Transcript_9089:93-1631(+)|eukprot:CAMPEP_0185727176 /NCGR_PEP_ID=MMETSP1171-20130828/2932_1 /TAXON_ID=374046 /ORGANISM="Helicotheca tamensis, Strain CCMP826" /LENGTH=512 /DNA_ID=CAMNT_0028395681 /DNA_START=75 /DNA_END=1613 /DNA_ORIENTATION=+